MCCLNSPRVYPDQCCLPLGRLTRELVPIRLDGAQILVIVSVLEKLSKEEVSRFSLWWRSHPTLTVTSRRDKPRPQPCSEAAEGQKLSSYIRGWTGEREQAV